MFLEPCGLFFQVTDTRPREGVSKDVGEGYGQTEEQACNNDGADDIRCVCEVVVGKYWDASIGLQGDPVQNRAQDWPVVGCRYVGAGA